MIRIRAIAAAIVLTPLIGGCALFHPSARADFNVRVPEQLSAEQYGAQQMALGRRMLDEGQYGQAIIAFRNVQHLPEYAAAAHNGLGIAYGQIGRFDLAERYFRLATTEAPSDARYQANLNRFYRSVPAVAVKSDRSSQMASAQEAVQPSQAVVYRTANATVRIELPAARTVKVSSNEVRIQSAVPTDVRRRAPRSQMSLAAPVAKPVLRRNSAYPVQIDLTARQ